MCFRKIFKLSIFHVVMSGERISDKMKEEHGKMLSLLSEFIQGKSGAYEKLKDFQARHAYAEEEAIIKFYEEKKDFKLLKTILEQHEQMRVYMVDVLTNKVIANKFIELMKEHLKLEDSKFYPLLDKEFSPTKQAELFENFMYLFNKKRK